MYEAGPAGLSTASDLVLVPSSEAARPPSELLETFVSLSFYKEFHGMSWYLCFLMDLQPNIDRHVLFGDLTPRHGTNRLPLTLLTDRLPLTLLTPKSGGGVSCRFGN